MNSYTATVRWNRSGDGDFAKGQYSRAHQWSFDGGLNPWKKHDNIPL